MIPKRFRNNAISTIILILVVAAIVIHFELYKDHVSDAIYHIEEQPVEIRNYSGNDTTTTGVMGQVPDSTFEQYKTHEDPNENQIFENNIAMMLFLNMIAGVATEEVRHEYFFSVLNHVRFITIDENESVVDEIEGTLLHEPGADYIGMELWVEQGSQLVVFDLEHDVSVIFMTHEFGKMSIDFPGDDGLLSESDDKYDEEFEFNTDLTEHIQDDSIGSRNIHGVVAKGFHFSFAAEEIEVRIANDDSLLISNRLKWVRSRNETSTAGLLPYGFPIEMTTYDKATGIKEIMKSIEYTRHARISLNRIEYPTWRTLMSTLGTDIFDP